ncbi:MAG TPA: hypothetical protein VJ810_17770 [Blastocatellia bacterium]|nr:hypothetical protein [Blastocatellia bacterium]
MIPLIFHLASFASLYKYIAWSVSHLGIWSLMLLSAFGAGAIFLRKCQFHSLAERMVFTLALGLGLWALALFVLGLCGALYVGVIWGLTIVSAAATIFYLIQNPSFRLSVSPSWKEYLQPRRMLVFGVAAMALAYAGLLLLAAWYPPMHWDALAGHLPLARQYLIEHRIVPLRGGAFPLLPALNHSLFAWAMALKDDVLAQMVEYTFLMLTSLGLFAWGQRLQRPGLGLAAAALWLSHPLVLWLGESAYVDVGVTCFAFLGVYALRVFWEMQDKREWGTVSGQWSVVSGRRMVGNGGTMSVPPQPTAHGPLTTAQANAWWLLSSALFGMAAGTKMPALFFVGAGAVLGLWARLRSWINWGELAKGWAVALILTVPWYGFIAYHTGNPVWPMFPQITRPDWVLSTKESFENLVGGGGLPKTFLNFLQLPVYLGLQPGLFFPDNKRDFAPAIALLPAAWIIAIWRRSIRWWSLWILAYTAYWFVFASFMRYWLPVLPLVGLALYEGLAWVLEKISKSSALHNLVWVVLTVLALGYGGRAVMKELKIKGRLPVTAESRRELLIGLSSGFRGVDYINRHAKPGDTACVFNGFYLAYYLQPRVTSMMHSVWNEDSPSSTLILPPREKWLEKVEANNTTWILAQHDGLNLPQQNPFDGPGGRSYELVYRDAAAYVWRRSPLPPDLSQDMGRLASGDPCADGRPATSTAAVPNYDGSLDTAECLSIEGWARDANSPDCPLSVNIYDGDALIQTITADRLRDDLARYGMGAGRHGFKYYPNEEVVKRFRDGRPHSIRVTIAGSEFALKDTPKSIKCPTIPGLQ